MKIANLLLVADELLQPIPTDMIYAVVVRPGPPSHEGRLLYPNVDIHLKAKVGLGVVLDWLTRVEGVQIITTADHRIIGKYDGAQFDIWGFA